MNAVLLLVATAWLPAAAPGVPQPLELNPAATVSYASDPTMAPESEPPSHGHGLWSRIKELFHHKSSQPAPSGCACGGGASTLATPGPAMKVLPQPAAAPMTAVIDGGVYERMPTTAEPPLR